MIEEPLTAFILNGGRPTGERNGGSKLTKHDVIAIRQRQALQRAIAKMLGTPQTNIFEIKKRFGWRRAL